MPNLNLVNFALSKFVNSSNTFFPLMRFLIVSKIALEEDPLYKVDLCMYYVSAEMPCQEFTIPKRDVIKCMPFRNLKSGLKSVHAMPTGIWQ